MASATLVGGGDLVFNLACPMTSFSLAAFPSRLPLPLSWSSTLLGHFDTGSGQPQVFNAGHLGMIAPICKGWGQFLRVLDMSCITNWVREDLQLGLGRAIARYVCYIWYN